MGPSAHRLVSKFCLSEAGRLGHDCPLFGYLPTGSRAFVRPVSAEELAPRRQGDSPGASDLEVPVSGNWDSGPFSCLHCGQAGLYPLRTRGTRGPSALVILGPRTINKDLGVCVWSVEKPRATWKQSQSRWASSENREVCHRSDLTWYKKDPKTITPGVTGQCSSVWKDRQGQGAVMVALR